MSLVTRLMKKEGLRPYMWRNTPNQRYAVRSHGYHRILYVIEGTLELIFPDSNQRIILRSGDIPAGTRHAAIVGSTGAQCVEASVPRD